MASAPPIYYFHLSLVIWLHVTDIYIHFLISVYIYNVNGEITVCKFVIDYSCNHTSRESNGPMLRVKIQTFQPNPGPSSVNNDLEYKAG